MAHLHLLNDLPVSEVIEPLRRALGTHHNAVLVAPPGAGKTTAIPLLLLDEPWLIDKKMVMLEPRRLAARGAARRMAVLLGEEVGDTVGFVTRDERKVGRHTRIEVVTEGVLTRRLQNDPSLEGVGLVIFDEIHERNVATDIGLTLLLDARTKLSLDIAILAMSATPEADVFARVLSQDSEPAPIISSAGRMFPVDIRYVPRQRNDRLEAIVSSTVMRALKEDEGDILIFLPGIGEINRTKQALEKTLPPTVAIHRLAGALPFAEQDAALAPSPSGERRVVLSTDIAETSLTVDGIHIVVDAGLSRVPRSDPRTGLPELTTVTSSRASSEQRAGRAGRVREGVAYRLWGKIDDATRLAHLPAEITQTDLTSLALELCAWGTPLSELAFLDAPPTKSLDRAFDTLRLLHLIEESNTELPTVTELGRTALALPVHPRLATMVARAKNSAERSWLACVLAALLEERDILRGSQQMPIDLSLRAQIVVGVNAHDDADRGGVSRVRERARDLARRASISSDVFISSEFIDHECGALLLSAYPDRLSMRRSTPGQFITRDGKGAWCDAKDFLAHELFLVSADLDADRKSSRIRRGAALDADQVAFTLGTDVIIERDLVWDKSRNDLVQRETRRVDSLRILEHVSEPLPCDETTEALLDRARVTQLEILSWTDDTESLRQRILFLRHQFGDAWPDVSRKTLLSTIDEWLRPYLAGCTSRRDLERLDMSMLLRSMLSWDESVQLDELAPADYQPPTGRPVTIDYTDCSAPSIDVRVQRMFGVLEHPRVLGGTLPLKVVLLSPADYPIQVTSDLTEFWKGSWHDVRREMAGRYPKHSWPEDPHTSSTF
jgi:ATP-dependent helicase HrpB